MLRFKKIYLLIHWEKNCFRIQKNFRDLFFFIFVHLVFNKTTTVVYIRRKKKERKQQPVWFNNKKKKNRRKKLRKRGEKCIPSLSTGTCQSRVESSIPCHPRTRQSTLSAPPPLRSLAATIGRRRSGFTIWRVAARKSGLAQPLTELRKCW